MCLQVIRRHAESSEHAAAWYGQFSMQGYSDFGPGSKALANYVLANRDVCWHLLAWRKHSHAPTTVANKMQYLAELDVPATIAHLLTRCPDFWQSKGLAEACACTEWVLSDTAFFKQVCMHTSSGAVHAPHTASNSTAQRAAC